MRAGGFPGNPGGLVVSIVKTAGGRAPAHQARGRGRSTWRPTERSRRCSDGTAGRRQRSAGGWTARSRSVSEYRRSGGIEPTRPRGGKGAPAGGTGGGKDGQHTEGGSRLHVTTTDSRTGQTSLGDGGGHRLASWTSGYATARSEAICRGAGCGRTRTSGSVGGQGQQRPWSTRPSIATATCRCLWVSTPTITVGASNWLGRPCVTVASSGCSALADQAGGQDCDGPCVRQAPIGSRPIRSASHRMIRRRAMTDRISR